jgi:sarcosine oxidase delta subunit
MSNEYNTMLKPCPFCGGRAKYADTSGGGSLLTRTSEPVKNCN